MQLDSNLSSLGYGPFFSDALDHVSTLLARRDLVAARVVSHLGALVAIAGARSTHAELSGRLAYELAPHERPTVGDWLAIADGARADDRAVIHAVLRRRTALIRRAAGTRGEPQAVAANVDLFGIVTSANRDANPRRVERYLAALAETGAAAVVIVNKSDLGSAAELATITAHLAPSALATPIIATSATSVAGVEPLRRLLAPGRTLALIGMSGVGKSSLVNTLVGAERQEVVPIDENDRGRHTTTRRELVPLPGGALLVDTPGMRIFGLAADDGGVASGFADISELAAACRFGDCRHASEPGCAVLAALADGTLAPARLASFRKLDREAQAYEARHNPTQAAQVRQRWKSIHVAHRARAKLDPKRR